MADNDYFYTGPWGGRAVMGPDDWVVRRDTYKAMILADGPVAYWRLGEASGDATDSSGNSLTGTASGVITYGVTAAIPPDPDKAVTLDGSSGIYQVTANSLFDFTGGPCTVECWFKSVQGTQGSLVERYSPVGQTGKGGYALRMGATGPIFWYSIDDPSTSSSINSGTDVYNNGAWHYVCGVNNGTSLLLYIDLKVYTPVAIVHNITAPSAALTLKLGAAGDNPAASLLSGSLDEVAIYAKVLSPNRILQHALGSPAATGYPRNI